MPYTLPKLKYAYDALEPHMDARTMEIHHSKHHQTYVDKLNAALEGSGFQPPDCVFDLLKNLDKVPENIRQTVRNQGGGAANHNFFWEVVGPGGGEAPAGALAEAIEKEYGGLEAFQKKFNEAAIGQFASGWAWAGVDQNKKLCVCSTPNHDAPYTGAGIGCGCIPVLVLDIWEHAYYLKYQNRRPEFVNAFWNAVNWPQVEAFYRKAL